MECAITRASHKTVMFLPHVSIYYTLRFLRTWMYVVHTNAISLHMDYYGVIKWLADPYRSNARSQGRWAIDVGANIGLITLSLLTSAPALRVLALEPSQSTFTYLMWNLRENGLDGRCIAANVGIGMSQGLLEFEEDLDWPTRANFSDGPTLRDSRADKTSHMLVNTMSDMLEGTGIVVDDVSFLKVDCEGCEWFLQHQVPELWLRVEQGIVALAAELHRFPGKRFEEWETLVLKFCGPRFIEGQSWRNRMFLTCNRNIEDTP